MNCVSVLRNSMGSPGPQWNACELDKQIYNWLQPRAKAIVNITGTIVADGLVDCIQCTFEINRRLKNKIEENYCFYLTI